MSEISVDFQTETFELDDEESEIHTFDWEWSDGSGSVKLNVDSIVGTMDAEVTVTPDSEEQEPERCWRFNDFADTRSASAMQCDSTDSHEEETDHYVTLPIDASFEVKTNRDFIQVNFYEKDIVESTKYFEQLEGHTYDSGTYATSMQLVER